MKWLRNFFFLIVLPIKFLSCTSGYKKIDGKWYYVSYDEGNWADKLDLEVDHNSFKVLNDNRFGKDGTKVFFEGKRLEKANAPTFKLVGNDYSADNNSVYYKTYPLFGANPRAFKLLKFPYSQDNANVFCGNIPMKVDDIGQFRVMKKGTVTFIQPLEVFLLENKEYADLDSSICKFVIFADGEAETNTSKYKGFKKIN